MHLIEVSVCFCSVILSATRQCSRQVCITVLPNEGGWGDGLGDGGQGCDQEDRQWNGWWWTTGGSVNGSGKNYLVILNFFSYLTKEA